MYGAGSGGYDHGRSLPPGYTNTSPTAPPMSYSPPLPSPPVGATAPGMAAPDPSLSHEDEDVGDAYGGYEEEEEEDRPRVLKVRFFVVVLGV